MTIIVSQIASASQRDYTWLLAALGHWSGNRSDLTSLLPDFVMLAEKRLNGDLESRHQETVVDLSAEAGLPTVAVPVDTAEIRSLSLQSAGPLEYLAPDTFSAQFASSAPGQPRAYTVIGPSIYPGPVPDVGYTLTLAYRAFLPPLADSAGTNWLIENFPNAYLAASMIELIGYTKNLAELPMWEQKYAAALDSVNNPDWTTASSMRVRSDVRAV
jgi:hypothetical protein